MNPIVQNISDPKTLMQLVASDILFFRYDINCGGVGEEFFEKVLAKLWLDLKCDLPEGALRLPKQMLKIEHQPGKLKVSDFFTKLTALFSSRFEQAGIDLKDRIPLRCAEYMRLQEVQQQWEDEALSSLWDEQGFTVQLDSLKDKRDWLKDPVNKPHLSSITELSLPALDLKAIPHEIAQFPNLKLLNLANNQLKVLPEFLEDLALLETILLAKNKLTALPEWIGNLPLLKNVYVNFNQITELPPNCFAKCKILTKVDLSYNQIMGPLSECFAHCSALTSLDLRSNQITEVPPQSFANCFKLQIVDLDENPVHRNPS